MPPTYCRSPWLGTAGAERLGRQRAAHDSAAPLLAPAGLSRVQCQPTRR
ncbi:MAG: hypothetical protein AAGK21_13410 [Bacteroidota bacterium]